MSSRSTRKNLVHVVDPYYGMYYRVQCTEFAPSCSHSPPCQRWWAPGVYIGPLSERTLDMESLDNRGATYVVSATQNEKSCRHEYVAGSIVREAPGTGLTDPLHFGGDPDTARFWVSLIPYFTGEIVPGMANFFDSGELAWKDGTIQCYGSLCRPIEGNHQDPLGLSENELVVAVGLIYRAYREDGYLLHSQQWWDYYVFAFVPDERTGSRSARFARRLYTDTPYHGMSLLTTLGSPLAAAPESRLAPTLSQYKDYLLELVKNRDVGRFSNTARDESIYRALESIEVSSINPIEFLRDIRNPKEVLENLFSPATMAKRGKNAVDILKLVSSLHLWWKYFIQTHRMTKDDLRNIARYVWERRKSLIPSIRYESLVGRGEYAENSAVDPVQGPVARNYSAKVIYKPITNSVDGWLDTLNILGFTPRLSDLWDVVPYSFVIDWVVDIGGSADRLELNGITQRMPLQAAVIGHRIRWTHRDTLDNGIIAITLNLRYSLYTRKVVDTLPDDMWFGKVFQDPRKHLFTGGALLVQYSLDK